ncbi:Crp/Fnr family transcriptional regulator, partial [Salinivirga cyanobacteriivorans]
LLMAKITNNDLELVYHLFSQITPVTQNDIEGVLPFLQKAAYAKNEKILDLGQTETRLKFVTKGIVHMYTYIDGDIFTINISLPGMLFNSLDSYLYKKPISEIQEAVSDVELLFLEKKDAEQLMLNNNTFCYIYAKLFEQVLSEREQRTLILQYRDASKRFKHFMNLTPYAKLYLQEVSQKLLAQYLGLAPETFCRVKSQYFKDC